LTPGSEPSFAVVQGPNDLALPFAADPDGNLTIFGLEKGHIEIVLGLAAPGRAALEGASP
jgi:hypothetical protein